jgi:hypothetical protein
MNKRARERAHTHAHEHTHMNTHTGFDVCVCVCVCVCVETTYLVPQSGDLIISRQVEFREHSCQC